PPCIRVRGVRRFPARNRRAPPARTPPRPGPCPLSHAHRLRDSMPAHRHLALPPFRAPSPLAWHALSLVVVVALAGWSAPARGASKLTWKAAVSGNAGTAANWTPAQIPGAADELFYTPVGSYSVTFDSAVPATSAMSFRLGTANLLVTNALHTIG